MGGAVFLPCWLLAPRCTSTGAHRLFGGARSWGGNGDLQEVSCQWVLTKTVTASVFLPTVSHSCPVPPQETLQYQQVGLAQAFMRSLLLFPESWCSWDFVCALQEWSFCFSQSCGISAIKPHLPSKPVSLGAPPPIGRPQAGKPVMGLKTFTPVGELLWYNYFLLCRLPTLWLWDLVLSRLLPSYHLVVASSLSFNIGYLFG